MRPSRVRGVLTLAVFASLVVTPASGTDCCSSGGSCFDSDLPKFDDPETYAEICADYSGTFIKNSVCVQNSFNTLSTCISSGNSGSVVGDPVMTGFDNQTFEFFGQSGHIYSVLSSPTCAFNMQLVPAGPDHLRHQGGEGTFVGAFGLVLPDCQVLAQVLAAGNMTLTANQANMDIENPHSLCGGRVVYEPYKQDLGQVLKVFEAPFELELVAVKAYNDTLSGYNRGHLNIHTTVTQKLEANVIVSGVLGDTLYQPRFDLLQVDPAAGPRDADYEVASLLAHSFSQPIGTVSRRLHAITPRLITSLPLTATIH